MEGSSSGGKGGFEFIRVDLLAKYLGASDAGLRFLLGLVSGKILLKALKSFARRESCS